MSKNYICPDCHNNTLSQVEGYDELYICDECGSELKGVMQYDGSMRFKEYCANCDLDDIEECKKVTEAAVTRNYDPEKQTDWALYIYNENDEVVNMSGFDHFITALEYAEGNNYPVIKVHNYYIENGKHYPDGNPIVIWKEGKAYNSFIEDENGPVPDGEEVHINESVEYSTYGTFRAEFVVRAESFDTVEEAVKESFEGTTVIGHLCSDVVISADDDNYNLTFDFEMLDKYAKKTEMFETILDTLADYNVSVVSYDFDQIK